MTYPLPPFSDLVAIPKSKFAAFVASLTGRQARKTGRKRAQAGTHARTTVCLFEGSAKAVSKSGIGQAMRHQRECLELNGHHWTSSVWDRYDVLQLNTVLPDSPLAAFVARLRGKKIVYYAHSTKEDFRNSFKGSNLFAPFFKMWITWCYNRGDLIVTPTPYSASILSSYGLFPPVRVLSNGVDTRFFSPSTPARSRFRRRYGIAEGVPVAISAGHMIERKGVEDFVELAKAMPWAQFFWFGYTDPRFVPEKVRKAVQSAPKNLHFPGFVEHSHLRDAYCGADAFVFCSREETEGIVMLEALACGLPVVVRDIPVYSGWLKDGENAYIVPGLTEMTERCSQVLRGVIPGIAEVARRGREVACNRDLGNVAGQLTEIYEDLDS
ncbi:MAG: glycosyltransferase family 4 protein [Actinomycetaceae bacterium]|nr:glycosyltransferase family 4 protein [Actinomycetaceae bacterium]